jgi:hypothetical protein
MASNGVTSAPNIRLTAVKETLANIYHLNVDKLYISETVVSLEVGGETPEIRNSNKSWKLNYTMLSFTLNGQLYSEYAHIISMLGML